MSDFKMQLNQGFALLRKRGYFAKQNWQCCQTCGHAAIPLELNKNYAFYHRQDTEKLRAALKRGKPEDIGVYLAWGGDGREIARCFMEAGCAVEWDGQDDKRIWVCPIPVELPGAGDTAP